MIVGRFKDLGMSEVDQLFIDNFRKCYQIKTVHPAPEHMMDVSVPHSGNDSQNH